MSKWNAFVETLSFVPELEFRLDVSEMGITEQAWRGLERRLSSALEEMMALEGGAIANPDENRQVGHYWLRAPDLAPDEKTRTAITETIDKVEVFGRKVRGGEIKPPGEPRFEALLLIGIGGSALGPQLAADALSTKSDALAIHFFDNTDPSGFHRVLEELGETLDRTLVVVVSKSGGTRETRNGLVEVCAALEGRGRQPAAQLVAVTGEGSALEQRAEEEKWLRVFPMWDWVGGRCSQTSAVGLLPMSLLGHDFHALLDGARKMDEATRHPDLRANPAARLAAAWFLSGGGRGDRSMVVLPYKDRLLLFSRYLQQLVMESLGKRLDLEGNVVEQGLSVFGNKGSTDQHAFVQQLRDGRNDFFVTFLGVVEDGIDAPLLEVEPGVTSGDYLLGFLYGTRRALADSARPSLTITIPRVDARSLGALIALFERAVGLYAFLAGINAYHQPGVEAGKKAATEVLDLQRELVAAMRDAPRERLAAPVWARRVGRSEAAVEALAILEHLASDSRRGVVAEGPLGSSDRLFGAETAR